MYDHSMEIKKGNRFEFDKNRRHFLVYINEDRIDETEKSFLGVVSGSGLFSLAARRLGTRVHSFDYDPQSVACTRELKNRYFPNDINWIVEEGSILNRDYINSLKTCGGGIGCNEFVFVRENV